MVDAMRLKSNHLQILIKLVTIEAKKNPSLDIDTLLDELEKAAEFRARTYKNSEWTHHKESKGPAKPSVVDSLGQLKRAKKKREAARPQLGETNYHPLFRDPAG